MDTKETRVDHMVEEITRAIAGRSTRRSLLGTASRAILGLLGIQILPVRLVDRRIVAGEHLSLISCSDWYFCGINGYLCVNCGGGLDSCPAGSTLGNFQWQACCTNPDACPPVSVYVSYQDCCTSETPPACGKVCKGANNCADATVWCPSGTSYVCTATFVESDQFC